MRLQQAQIDDLVYSSVFTCSMDSAGAALPGPLPHATVYLTSECFNIRYGRAGERMYAYDIKADLRLRQCLQDHKFFLGNLLVEDRDEHVTFSMEFFLYQVNLLAAKQFCRNA